VSVFIVYLMNVCVIWFEGRFNLSFKLGFCIFIIEDDVGGDDEYLNTLGCFDVFEAIQQCNAGECHFIYRSRKREYFYSTNTFVFTS
jgi:hypothetical protein